MFSARAESFYLAVAQKSGGLGPRLRPLASSVGLRPEREQVFKVLPSMWPWCDLRAGQGCGLTL